MKEEWKEEWKEGCLDTMYLVYIVFVSILN